MKLIPSLLLLLLLKSNCALSQKTEVSTLIFSGTIVSGYANTGGYINFTGPGAKLQKGSSDLMIGVLPTLRFKKDSGITKNSLITPSLGVGITYTYKFIAIQIPFYYNSKTAILDGRWNMGIGVGINLNKIINK